MSQLISMSLVALQLRKPCFMASPNYKRKSKKLVKFKNHMKTTAEILDYIEKNCPVKSQRNQSKNADIILFYDKNDICEAIDFFKKDNELSFKILLDLFGIDMLTRAEKRFEITVTPQKDICPQGRQYPIKAVAIINKKIIAPMIQTKPLGSMYDP